MKQVQDNTKVLMKFEATWCQPCKNLTQVLDDLNPDLEIQVFNADVHHSVFKEFGVRNIPTLILFEHGAELKRTTGAMSKNALEIFIGD